MDLPADPEADRSLAWQAVAHAHAGASYEWSAACRRLLAEDRGDPLDRLESARVLAAGDDFYGWREKDWDRTQFAQGSGSGYGFMLLDLVRRHPEVLPAMACWLDDDRPVGRASSTEAAVSDIATAVLLKYRSSPEFAAVCRAVAARESPGRLGLLRRYAHADLEPMYDLISDWVAPGAPGYQREYATVCLYDQVHRGGDALPSLWFGILEVLLNGGNERIADQALLMMLTITPTDEALVERFRQRYPVSEILVPVELDALSRSSPELVCALLAGDIERGGHDERVEWAVRLIVDLMTDSRVAGAAGALTTTIIRRADESRGVASALCSALDIAVRAANADPCRSTPPAQLIIWSLRESGSALRSDLVNTLAERAEHTAVLRGTVLAELLRSNDVELLRYVLAALERADAPPSELAMARMALDSLQNR